MLRRRGQHRDGKAGGERALRLPQQGLHLRRRVRRREEARPRQVHDRGAQPLRGQLRERRDRGRGAPSLRRRERVRGILPPRREARQGQLHGQEEEGEVRGRLPVQREARGGRPRARGGGGDLLGPLRGEQAVRPGQARARRRRHLRRHLRAGPRPDLRERRLRVPEGQSERFRKHQAPGRIVPGGRIREERAQWGGTALQCRDGHHLERRLQGQLARRQGGGHCVPLLRTGGRGGGRCCRTGG